MSNNKNQNKKAGANKSETKKPVSKQENTEEVSLVKKLFSEKNLAVVITAICLVAILLVGGIFVLVRGIVRDENFDYAKANLSKYMEFTADYKNFNMDIDFAP